MRLLPLLMLLGSLLLSACGILPGGPVNVEGIQATPTATLDPSGYQAIETQACQVSSLSSMQSERRTSGQMQWLQGSLVAFQPAHNRLAYIAPSERTSWFSGELTIVSAPEYAERRLLAPNIQAIGDLTWSPDGDWLAFLAFRPNENLQTVMVVHDDGTRLTDLFPTDLARTDSRTSQKAILGWKDDTTIQVIASCGEECRQAFDINVNVEGELALTPSPVASYQKLAENLQIPFRTQEYQPERFPKNMTSPNWSPDDSRVSYLDRRGILWVLFTAEKLNYPIDIGLRDVIETQWSSDSAWLAVRAEDRVFVYQVPCNKTGK